MAGLLSVLHQALLLALVNCVSSGPLWDIVPSSLPTLLSLLIPSSLPAEAPPRQ